MLQPLRQLLRERGQPLPADWQRLFSEVERTGYIPWERIGTLWAGICGGYPAPCPDIRG